MLSTAWTDDRVDRLTQLWTDGLSAREIARALGGGVTRNAVIGKLHRLGLLGARGPVSAKPRTRPARTAAVARRRRAPKAHREADAARAPDWQGEVACVEALGPHHCRWPMGDPRDDGFSFCGRWAEAGPYCPAHCAVAFVRDRAKAVVTVRAA